jgi:hypothetical protein
VRVNWWEASREARRHFIFDDQSPNLPLLYIACYYGIDALAWKLLTKAFHLKFLQLLHRNDKRVSCTEVCRFRRTRSAGAATPREWYRR